MKISTLLIVFLLLFPSVNFAEEYEESIYYANFMRLPDAKKTTEAAGKYRGAFEAEQLVRNLPCTKQGKTVDMCLSERGADPYKTDYGWDVYFNKDEGYIVERAIGFTNNTTDYSQYTDNYNTNVKKYKWSVSSSGEIKAISGGSIGIEKNYKRFGPN